MDVGIIMEILCMEGMRCDRLSMCRKVDNIMFGTRIIACTDGTEIIDRNLKTPYKALTPIQMVEYIEMDVQLAIMDKMERRAKEEAERKRKLARNPIYKMACLCGLV